MPKETEDPKTAIAPVAAEGGLALFDASEIGAGFENTSQDDFKVPFISLLQTLSPQCNPAKSQYLPDAKPGMFFDASTGELMKDFEVVPCYYKRQMVEWKPDNAGFVAQHDPGFELNCEKDAKGFYHTKDGNLLIDTRYYFCLRMHADGETSMAILALSKTQIKRSKAWMSAMDSRTLDGPGGKKYKAPMYSATWKISSVIEQKGDWSWFGYKMELGKPVASKELLDKLRGARVTFQTVQVKPPVDVEAEDAGSPTSTM